MRRWIEPNWKYTKAIESNRSVDLLLYHSSMRCNGLFIPLVVADLQQLGLLSRRKQIQPTARCCNGESASWTIRAATYKLYFLIQEFGKMLNRTSPDWAISLVCAPPPSFSLRASADEA